MDQGRGGGDGGGDAFHGAVVFGAGAGAEVDLGRVMGGEV